MAKKAYMDGQKRDKILLALLESSNMTEAAEKAGISRHTLYNYIHGDATFADAFKQLRERTLTENIEVIEADRQQAKEVIRSIMLDDEQPAAVRLKAAQALLDGSQSLLDRVDKMLSDNIAAHSDIFDIRHSGNGTGHLEPR